VKDMKLSRRELAARSRGEGKCRLSPNRVWL
jgi:hypothetical protein